MQICCLLKVFEVYFDQECAWRRRRHVLYVTGANVTVVKLGILNVFCSVFNKCFNSQLDCHSHTPLLAQRSRCHILTGPAAEQKKEKIKI